MAVNVNKTPGIKKNIALMQPYKRAIIFPGIHVYTGCLQTVAFDVNDRYERKNTKVREMRSSIELKVKMRSCPGTPVKGAPCRTAAPGESRRVRVGVRVRPPIGGAEPSPLSGGPRRVRAALEGQLEVSYDFDRVFWPDDGGRGQATLFEELAEPLLDAAVDGYNACLFAYGQTGSGKTYSMMGPSGRRRDDRASAGVIPRFCRGLFERTGGRREAVVVRVGYYEIYNEKIRDLLAADSSSSSKTPLRVREHPVAGPHVEGLASHRAASFEQIEALIAAGDGKRATAATLRNDRSSRSHAILELSIETTKNDVPIKSKVSLVDLAGSERVASHHASGDRFKEGLSINKSLLTLGKVITSLSDAKKSNFVPYRESVLTWLLKENLGENSCTVMLATITPEASCLEETLATLRYACRARRIVNKVSVNEDPQAKIIRDLKKEIDKLKCARSNLSLSSSVLKSPSVSDRNAYFNDENLQSQLKKLTAELQAAEKRRDELESQKDMYIKKVNADNVATYESDFYEVLQGILDDSNEEAAAAASNRNCHKEECATLLENIKESLTGLEEICSFRPEYNKFESVLPLLLNMKNIHKEVCRELLRDS